MVALGLTVGQYQGRTVSVAVDVWMDNYWEWEMWITWLVGL